MNQISCRTLFLTLSLLSPTVFYPTVHELGHYIAACMFHVNVNYVVWTIWGGSPHISLGDTPPEAIPWIDAVGILVPTVLGSLGVLFWNFAYRRLNGIVSIVLLVPVLFLLAGNLGLPRS
jgi:hypothetical protein